MKLLSEDVNSNIEVCTESTKAGKMYYIEGIFAQADVVNGNRRIYPSKVLMPQVEKYIENWVNKGKAIGECEHPIESHPNLNRASHLITSLKIEGNNVIGKARILSTESGKNVSALLEGGVKLGVSTRGLASISENADGVSIIQDDYLLTTVDIVGNPSAPDAYVNGVLESKEFILESGIIVAKQNFTPKKIALIKEIFSSMSKTKFK